MPTDVVFPRAQSTWTWKQSAGELWRDGKLVAKGYSGAPGHVNATKSEGLRNKGPIPRGLWRMASVFPKHEKLGTVAISLRAVGHDAMGRSDFMIHGESILRRGTASEGCIILDYATRVTLSNGVGRSGEDLIEVV